MFDLQNASPSPQAFDQIQGLDLVVLSRIMLVVSWADVITELRNNFVFIVLVHNAKSKSEILGLGLGIAVYGDVSLMSMGLPIRFCG